MLFLALSSLVGCTGPGSISTKDGAVDTSDTASGDNGGDSNGGDSNGGDSNGGDSNGGDTGPSDCPVTDATATPARAMATVLTVDWTTEGAGNSVVEWGYTDRYGYRTIDTGDSTRSHSVVVVGPAPGQTVHWRVRSRVDGSDCLSADQTTTIAAARSPLSQLTLNDSKDGFSSGFRVMPLTGDTPGAAIVDDEGRQVWWHHPEAGVSVVQTWMDKDNLHVLYLVEDTTRTQDIGGIYRVSLDQTEEDFIPLHFCHHAFVQLEDGRYAFLQTDPREYQRSTLAGDAVVLVDADGSNAETIYSTWDQFHPDLNHINEEGSHYYPDYLDWTHGNSINLRPDGSFLVSFHGIDAIINLRESGDVRWTMTGQDPVDEGEFTWSGSATDLFANQHSPKDVDGNLMLFNNGSGLRDSFSQAIEYEIDETRHTFSTAWKFDWGQSRQVQIEGDVQRMDNGNTLVDWGSEGVVTEVTNDGDIVWELSSSGAIIGFMEYFPQAGAPVR